MNRLLVIIVTYNAMRWIERCFASLAASSVPCDVFVVDNGSSDGTLDWLDEHRADNLIVKRSESNCGFGAGNNVGLRYALERGYDYVYLLNQDAWVAEDCFEKLIAAAGSHPGYGILSPVQLQADWKTMDRLFAKHCGKAVAAVSELWPETGSRAGSDSSSTSGDDGISSFNAEVVPVKFVMAAHWLISRECLEAVGGFSPTFSQYGEDDNYIDRARYWAFRTGVVPAAKAVHDRAQRVSSRATQMRLKYLGCVARLSDPGRHHLRLRLMAECLRIIGMAMRRMSWTMLCYLPRLVSFMPTILENRRASTRRGAFI
jgi:N-acetylglucosaminyl-diphospho-decaprenol L-rhamnosyltransferase